MRIGGKRACRDQGDPATATRSWIEGEMVGSSIGMTATRRLAYAVVAALVVLVASTFGSASASASITMSSPAPGSFLNDPTPPFSGTTDDLLDEVTLKIYAGTAVEESALVQTVSTPFPPTGGTWSLEPTAPLSDGTTSATSKYACGSSIVTA